MLPLTPYTLHSVYKFLCSTPPFESWNLPDASDVVFKVVRDRSRHGRHYVVKGRQVIEISSGAVGHTMTLVQTMAHEMIHVHQDRTRMSRTHGPAFMKLAQLVCKIHGFDPKAF